MDPRNRRRLLQLLIILSQPTTDIILVRNIVLQAVVLLLKPDPLLDIRNRLFSGDNVRYHGRDVFERLSDQRYTFFQMTGETPETFIDLVNSINIPVNNGNILSKRNRFLLVFIWLRSYPCYSVLSAMFNISLFTVKYEIRQLLTVLDNVLAPYLQWPTVQEWLSYCGVWRRINIAVGAIDGTSHEIYRPISEQEQFYSGHRRYHCLHSQVVIDNYGKIRHIATGFLGHLNDAQQFMLLSRIGEDLDFPRDCVLLADQIYPNRHPLMTQFTAAQILQKVGQARRQALRLNKYISRYRIQVEHTIGELKTYKCTSSIWRHPRNLLSRTVRVCAKLVCRRKDIELIL